MEAPIVSSPRVGWSPDPLEVRRGQPGREPAGGHEPGVDARRAASPRSAGGPRRSGPSRSGSVATRPNGAGVAGIAGEDALELGRPVGEHLVHVGEDLARTPVGLGLRAVGGAERPRLALDERSAQVEQVGAGVPEPRREIGHAPSLARGGVAWMARPSRPRAGSPFRGRTAAETGRARRRGAARRATDDRHARPGSGQPGRRPRQQERLRRGPGLPAPQGHRPRRVLGRQRPPGRPLLPAAVGLHADRLRRPRDGRPRPDELRHAPERHHVRRDRRPRPGQRDRRARPRHGDGVKDIAFAVDDAAASFRETTTRGAQARDRAGRARRRRGRRPPPVGRLHLRRGPPQLHRPERLPRRLRAGLPEGQEAGAGRPGPEPPRDRPLRRQRRARRHEHGSSTTTATSSASPS